MWKMTYIFGNWLKCFKNDQNMYDVDLWEMAQMCGEMTSLFDKRLKDVGLNLGNGQNNWKFLRYMGHVFEKRVNYVGNGLRI